MKILRLAAYFFPEQMSSAKLQMDRLEHFSDVGFDIEVYAPTPTRGIDFAKYRKYKNIKYEELFDGKVKIHRFQLMREGRNTILRAFRYFILSIKHCFYGLKSKNTDVIYASSTPPIQGIVCAFIKRRLIRKTHKYIPLIYNLQDIFPDSMVSAGMSKKGGLLWKIGRCIEDYTYKNADKIIVISEGFKKNILEKGVPEEKIEVIPNWIDTGSVVPIQKKDNKLYDKLKLDKDKFTVVYAGNFGASQGADIVVKAAEMLKNQNTIQFVVFGGGSEYESVKEYVNSKSMENIKLFDLLPVERVSEVYSLGDIAIITGKKGVGKSGMPSKTWSIMACNTPILASFDTDSELSNILKQTGAGVCIEPENSILLADTIVRIHNKELCFALSGREYVCKYASKEKCLTQYQDVIEGVF